VNLPVALVKVEDFVVETDIDATADVIGVNPNEVDTLTLPEASELDVVIVVDDKVAVDDTADVSYEVCDWSILVSLTVIFDRLSFNLVVLIGVVCNVD
jgi:hypothetical protein